MIGLPFQRHVPSQSGAADRLHLQDEKTKKELPAALLKIGEKTLLESLIFDLQAKEYLYYKIFGKKIITPIVMMTSSEKQNDAHIRSICERSSYFLRPKVIQINQVKTERIF